MYAPDPHAFPLAPLTSDPLSDSDDRLPDDKHPPFDLSAPPPSLDSFLSEYRRMVEYVCGLLPQAVGAAPVTPLPRALFESFFASATPSQQSLSFNWFDQVHMALVVADECMVSYLAAGRSDRLFIPPRHNSYAVRGEHAPGKAVPINKSLLAHFEKPVCPSLLVGLSVRDSLA